MNPMMQAIDDGLIIRAQELFIQWARKEHGLDAIEAERIRPIFKAGFTAAMQLQPSVHERRSLCVQATPDDVYLLMRIFLRYIMAIGQAGNLAPRDVMAALVMCITTIGRNLQPTYSHTQVFEVMTREAESVLKWADARDSSAGETTH